MEVAFVIIFWRFEKCLTNRIGYFWKLNRNGDCELAELDLYRRRWVSGPNLKKLGGAERGTVHCRDSDSYIVDEMAEIVVRYGQVNK